MVRKIKLTNEKLYFEDEIQEINEGVVKQIGNGAIILSSKKHIRKKVYILIKKN